MAQNPMKDEWDKRAEEDAFRFVHGPDAKNEEYIKRAGEEHAEIILNPVLDRWNRDPSELTALEIGCGVGRLCRPMSRHFNHVIGVDVSGEMIEKAKNMNSDLDNIEFYENDGRDLDNIDTDSVDFVLSYVVFQHVPDNEIIENYIEEIARVGRKDARCLLHFQAPQPDWIRVFGTIPVKRSWIPKRAKIVWKKIKDGGLKASPTWMGTTVSREKSRKYLEENGFNIVNLYIDPTHNNDRYFYVADISK